MSTSASREQCAKHSAGILVKPSDNDTVVRAVQPVKACQPNDFTLDGNWMEVSDEQQKNALTPISSTPSGIVMEVNDVQLENAS